MGPPAVFLDSSFEYDEYLSGEDIISDDEVSCLVEESLEPLKEPAGYMAVWVNIDSLEERIAHAKEQLAIDATKPNEPNACSGTTTLADSTRSDNPKLIFEVTEMKGDNKSSIGDVDKPKNSDESVDKGFD